MEEFHSYIRHLSHNFFKLEMDIGKLTSNKHPQQLYRIFFMRVFFARYTFNRRLVLNTKQKSDNINVLFESRHANFPLRKYINCSTERIMCV